MTPAGAERYYGGEPDRPGGLDPSADPGSGYGSGPGSGSGHGSGSGPGSGYGSAPPAARPRRRRRWVRTVSLVLLGLFLLFVVGSVSTYFWASGKLTKIGALADYPGRPAQGGGTNWLIVGSDSRSTLTPAQKQQFHAGSDAGQRSDTILLLHYGASGPDLISIPRDSYVTIPAYTDASGAAHGASKNKINAAYSLGGAKLLVQTVEQVTDLRIDHYLEIGFLGVVNVVNAVGGVNMCLPSAVHDDYSGADLPAGCQTLDGQQALALIRSRYSLPDSDISRMADQQDFVSALVQATLRPWVLGNPFVFYPMLASVLDSIAVDDGTSVWSLLDLAWNSKSITGGRGTVGTVPIADQGYDVSGLGSTVLWDGDKARQLFAAVAADKAIPPGLLNSLG